MATKLENITSKLQSALAVANALPEAIDITIPLADLNAVNGGTAATTIGAAVDNAEAHASSQEALIAQITSALDGKVAGGGSSGGGSVETCTVTFVNFESNNLHVFGTRVQDDGTIIPATMVLFADGDSAKFVKNSPLLVMDFNQWKLIDNTLAITSNQLLHAYILDSAISSGAMYIVLEADRAAIEFIG